LEFYSHIPPTTTTTTTTTTNMLFENGIDHYSDNNDDLW
jgi:hypothetical protein